MDRASEIAQRLVDQYRSLFRQDTSGMADGLANAIAGELRAEASRIRREAVTAAERTLADIRAIQ